MSNKEQKKKLNIDDINHFLSNFSVKKVNTEDSDDDKPIPYTKPPPNKSFNETSTHLNHPVASNSKVSNTSQIANTKTLPNPAVFIPPSLSKPKLPENLKKKETISNPFAQFNPNQKIENNPNDLKREETNNEPNIVNTTISNTISQSVITPSVQIKSENNNLNELTMNNTNETTNIGNKNNFFDDEVKQNNNLFEDTYFDNNQTLKTSHDKEFNNNYFDVSNNDSSSQTFKEPSSSDFNLINSQNVYKKPETKCMTHTIQKKHDLITGKSEVNNSVLKHTIQETENVMMEKPQNQVNFVNIYNEFQTPLNEQVLSSFDNIVDSHLQDENLETINLNATSERVLNEVSQKDEKSFKPNVQILNESKQYSPNKRSFKKVAFPGHFSQNRLIYSAKQNKVILQHYDKLLNSKNSIEGFLDNNYFPLNYGEGSIENLKKIKNLFQKILAEGHLSFSVEEFSLVLIINNFLFSEKYNMTMFRSQGSLIREDFCAISKNIFAKKSNLNTKWNIKENEGENRFNFEEFDLNKVLETCSKSKNFSSLLFFSLFGKKEDLNQYILEVFEECVELKQNPVYILLMIKLGKISKLIAEKGDFIIDNLYLILHLLAKNFNHLDEINIELLFSTLDKHISNLNQKCSLDKYLIIKLLNKSFTNYNLDQFTNLIIQFLKSENNFKVLIVDFINYLFYINIGGENNESRLKVIGFSSILMKLKYVMYQNSRSRISPELSTFCDKIIEKKEQFGSYSNNQWFIQYISSLKTLKKPSNNYKSDQTITSTNAPNVNSSNQNQTGIKSILSTFGLFSDNKVKKEETRSTNNPPNKSESITYDPILKRYLINGEVPKEDGPMNKPETKKVEMKSNTVLPPPIKAKNATSSLMPDSKNVKNEAENKVPQETPQTNMNNPFINNPFNVPKQNLGKNESESKVSEDSNQQVIVNNPFNVPKQTLAKVEAPKVVKKPLIVNINARYASAIDKK